jgi:Mg-chelatase subunit ChlD
LENPKIIGIFFDVSGSRKADKHIEREIQGVSGFLRSVWRRGDRGFAMAFSNKLFTLAEPTEDLNKVVSALPAVTQEPYYGGTALYDALLSARFHQSSNDDIRLYVVLSDFEDNNSNHSRSNLIAELKENGISVFPVLLGQNFTPLFSKKGHKRELEAATEVANHTGGEVLEPISDKDIEPQLQRIANVLQGTYWIQCEPLPEGTIIRSVQLDSTRPRVRILYARD